MRIRKAAHEDIKKFPSICDQTYNGYSMYTVRTPHYYDLIEELNLKKEHVLVAEENGTIVGFALTGIKNIGLYKSMSIYEIAALTKKGYTQLIQKIEEMGNKYEVAFIDTVAPEKSDLAVHLGNSEFLESRPIATMAYVLNIKNILTLFVKNAVKKYRTKNNTILFCVGEEKIVLKLPEGVLDTDMSEFDFKITISPNDLFLLLLKRKSFFSLILTRKMKVTPVTRVVSAWNIMNYLATHVKMMLPFADTL